LNEGRGKRQPTFAQGYGGQAGTKAQRHPSTAPFGRELRAERLGADRRKVLGAEKRVMREKGTKA